MVTQDIIDLGIGQRLDDAGDDKEQRPQEGEDRGQESGKEGVDKVLKRLEQVANFRRFSVG